jgi:hypothetical protein
MADSQQMEEFHRTQAWFHYYQAQALRAAGRHKEAEAHETKQTEHTTHGMQWQRERLAGEKKGGGERKAKAPKSAKEPKAEKAPKTKPAVKAHEPSQPKSYQKGKNGGMYYVNEHGKKVYVGIRTGMKRR